jgi:hypothetical protein
MTSLRLGAITCLLLFAPFVLPIQAETANNRPVMTPSDSLRSNAIAEGPLSNQI